MMMMTVMKIWMWMTVGGAPGENLQLIKVKDGEVNVVTELEVAESMLLLQLQV
jgi:hypothetical protein